MSRSFSKFNCLLIFVDLGQIRNMSGYSGPPPINPYWYYDPHGYQPNVSVSFNTNISGSFNRIEVTFDKISLALFFSSVNTPSTPSCDMYNTINHNNKMNNSQFADSGYLSRTPTPPSPMRITSPQTTFMKDELDRKGIFI